MSAADNYCIKPGYQSNSRGNLTLDADGRQYWTARRIYTSAFFQHQVYERAAALAREKNLQSAIDVGCGPAIKLMRLLAPVCRRVAGVDQQSAIDLCRERYPRGEFHAENLEAPSESLRGEFDLIICADVIEHMADRCAPSLSLSSGERRSVFRDLDSGARCSARPGRPALPQSRTRS
ncbi:MAG: class I SAM-dependent methyltransferase [Chloroflexi bacterium]|nr:class I SAM-dependent methyltransferase [Chloroflexota bacterium]